MWAAKQKFDGEDILLRREMPSGPPIAVLEMAHKAWQFAAMFGVLQNGRPVFESPDESRVAARQQDEFVDFLMKLDSTDPMYWQKVEAKLA